MFVFTTMLVAQASGVDIFGALARWTSETLSFGNSRISKADAHVSIIFDKWEKDKTNDSFFVHVSKQYRFS